MMDSDSSRSAPSVTYLNDSEHHQTDTERFIEVLMQQREAQASSQALTVAKQCILDWLGCALAARKQPLVRILVEELAPTDMTHGCKILGFGRRASIDQAVVINGAMGHALDFDDVIIPMGHPSVPVVPVVLALGEELQSSGAEVLAAFIAGVEAECRVAELMGPSHYQAGWHGTATYGTFGAAAAAAHLYRLDRAQMLHAIGLAGTQAAGLKCMFGTMAKPLHAGKAAQNGLLAARLARKGFTSATDVFGVAQGFAAIQSTTADIAAALVEREQPYVVDTLFKYHAACYLAHNTIAAAQRIRGAGRFSLQDIARVDIRVQQIQMQTCNIEAPRSGLECKFSLRMVCALALSGENTADEALYSDITAAREDLQEICRKTVVEPTSPSDDAIVVVRLRDGRTFTESRNVAVPERDLQIQQHDLERKFRSLVRDALSKESTDIAVDVCRNLELHPNILGLLGLCESGLPI